MLIGRTKLAGSSEEPTTFVRKKKPTTSKAGMVRKKKPLLTRTRKPKPRTWFKPPTLTKKAWKKRKARLRLTKQSRRANR